MLEKLRQVCGATTGTPRGRNLLTSSRRGRVFKSWMAPLHDPRAEDSHTLVTIRPWLGGMARDALQLAPTKPRALAFQAGARTDLRLLEVDEELLQELLGSGWVGLRNRSGGLLLARTRADDGAPWETGELPSGPCGLPITLQTPRELSTNTAGWTSRAGRGRRRCCAPSPAHLPSKRWRPPTRFGWCCRPAR